MEANCIIVGRCIFINVVLHSKADTLVFSSIFVVRARNESVEFLLGSKELHLIRRHTELDRRRLLACPYRADELAKLVCDP